MTQSLRPWPRRLSKLGRFRIKTMDLYVSKTFLLAYAICAVSFIGLFVLIEAFAKLDRFLRQDSSLVVTILKYHLAMIPTAYANYMGPILTLAAAMFTRSRLLRNTPFAPTSNPRAFSASKSASPMRVVNSNGLVSPNPPDL